MLQPVTQQTDLQALWVAFSRSETQQDYCHRWLELQCARISDARAAVLVLRAREHDPDPFQPAACLPADEPPAEALVGLTEDVIEDGSGLVAELTAGSGEYGVAYPLRIDDEIAGVVAVQIGAQDDAALAVAMEKLQWGIAWVELLLRRHRRGVLERELPRIKLAMEIVTAVLAEDDYESAASAFVTRLAAAFGAERVSLGTMERERIRVRAVSNSAEFGKAMNLVRLLEAAMEEAVFQRSEIALPPPREAATVCRDHRALADKHGCGAVVTLPLFEGDAYIGAVTLERGADEPFMPAELDRVRAVVALCSEALAQRRRADRGVLARLGDGLHTQLGRMLGRGYLGRKLVGLGLVAVTLFLALAHDTYRVAADSRIEGLTRQVIAAPFDAYLAAAPARAGDLVTAGAELCRLDDRELRLERVNWTSERAQLERRREEALARHDRGEARVLMAELEQNRAQLDLVESRLARTRLTAPFDGLVVSGDLSQRIGGTVEQGEVLLEIAPLDRYRLILWVDEHAIADIAPGQAGSLVLKALPERQFPFAVTAVTPITEARDGANFFRVESLLEHAPPALRPGMEGVAKITVGERRVGAILLRPVLDWLRLKLWAWTP